jgi:hypothetical protein
MTQKVGRGNNPNSHHNKQKLGKRIDLVITPEQSAIARELMPKNKSAGIRMLLDFAIALNSESLAKLKENPAEFAKQINNE